MPRSTVCTIDGQAPSSRIACCTRNRLRNVLRSPCSAYCSAISMNSDRIMPSASPASAGTGTPTARSAPSVPRKLAAVLHEAPRGVHRGRGASPRRVYHASGAPTGRGTRRCPPRAPRHAQTRHHRTVHRRVVVEGRVLSCEVQAGPLGATELGEVVGARPERDVAVRTQRERGRRASGSPRSPAAGARPGRSSDRERPAPTRRAPRRSPPRPARPGRRPAGPRGSARRPHRSGPTHRGNRPRSSARK